MQNIETKPKRVRKSAKQNKDIVIENQSINVSIERASIERLTDGNVYGMGYWREVFGTRSRFTVLREQIWAKGLAARYKANTEKHRKARNSSAMHLAKRKT